MSQSSLPASASFDSPATLPWISNETLKRATPGFRAVLDGVLIFLGGGLAFSHLQVATLLSEGSGGWKLDVFLISNLLLGLLWIAIAYCTARSSRWQDRQRVLVCLSLTLFLYAAMSSIGLGISEYPEAVRVLLLAVSVPAAVTLICIGLISVEQRLRSAIDSAELPERVASKGQCCWRIFYGCLFGVLAICCLAVPFAYVNGIFSGSFAEHFEEAYGCQISGFNFFCLTALSLLQNLNYLLLGFLSWLYLQQFHQQVVPSFRDKLSPACRPVVNAGFICVGGAFTHIFLFAIFHPGPDVAPWMLLATVVCAWAIYKRSSAKAAVELKQSSAA